MIEQEIGIHLLANIPPTEPLPTQKISQDWFGNCSSSPIEFALGLTDEHLLVESRGDSPPSLHPSASPAAFIEGLWDYDVLELFIGEAGQSAYQEWNFGPRGSWWMAMFESPRRRKEDHCNVSLSTPIVTHFPTPLGWTTRWIFPRYNFPCVNKETSELQMNVTAIRYHRECPTFWSWYPPEEGEPDFHCPNLRGPVHFQYPSDAPT